MLPSLALPRSGSRGRYTVQRSASSQPRPQLPQHLRIDTKSCYAARLGLSTQANNWEWFSFTSPPSLPSPSAASANPLLVLDAAWSPAETNAFFARNRIELNRVSAMEIAANSFFVETAPGFPSLDLANTLAAQDGVRLSSPNWWREHTLQ